MKHEVHIYIFEHPTQPQAVGQVEVEIVGFQGFSSTLYRKATEQGYRVLKQGGRRIAQAQREQNKANKG